MGDSTAMTRSTIQKRDAAGVVRHGGEWLVIWSDPDSIKSVEERLAEAHATARQGEHQRHIAAALRSVARRPGLKVSFGSGAATLDINLPAIPLKPTRGDLDVSRGMADSAALFLRHHNARVHAKVAPGEARARAIFDCLERARCEALGICEMPGISANVTAALARRLQDLGLSRAHIAAQIPLLEALPMVAIDALLGRSQPTLATGAMEMWHRFARARFGAELLALGPMLADQAAFGAAAHEVVRAIFNAMEWDPQQPPRTASARDSDLLEGVSDKDETATRLGGATASVEVEDPTAGEPNLPSDQVSGAEPRPAPRTAPAPYSAYTEEFDRVSLAEDLATPDEMSRLRQNLDEQLGDMRAQLARLANRLQRQLLSQQNTSWDFDLDEGLLDSGRLDRVIVHPGTALSFKQERAAGFMDTVVSILIDNSGSMRGRPIALAAMSADLAARALDRCGIRCEILGFTTRNWKGGSSAKKWAAEGRPARPGRINDLLHIVYKSASSSYRHAYRNLGLMLKDGILKENIDGEALSWAVRRLHMCRESRKILLVISDGAPVDQATLGANEDPKYLDSHLREVIAGIENAGEIELSAIGIKHDVRSYYTDAAMIDSAEILGAALLSQLGRSFQCGTLRSRKSGSP
jgi:cobaltochelatase CobT